MRTISTAGPAAPAIAIMHDSSMRKTFSRSRVPTAWPSVASRSPAMSTPSLHTIASTVVPWMCEIWVQFVPLQFGSRSGWSVRRNS